MTEHDDYWIRLNLTRARYDALVMALKFHQAESKNKVALAASRDLLGYVTSKPVQDRRYRDKQSDAAMSGEGKG